MYINTSFTFTPFTHPVSIVHVMVYPLSTVQQKLNLCCKTFEPHKPAYTIQLSLVTVYLKCTPPITTSFAFPCSLGLPSYFIQNRFVETTFVPFQPSNTSFSYDTRILHRDIIWPVPTITYTSLSYGTKSTS